MKLRVLVGALQEKKASDVLVLDLRGKTSFCDWFVLCSGNTPRHVQAMANSVLSKVRTDHQMRPIGSEGLAAGRWALLDYDDVLVHIFEAPLRRYYDLEGLWLDAGRLTPSALGLPDAPPASADDDDDYAGFNAEPAGAGFADADALEDEDSDFEDSEDDDSDFEDSDDEDSDLDDVDDDETDPASPS